MRHVDPYLPAEKLGLSERDKNILIGVARDLEAGSIDLWGMGCWSSCICGQMIKRGAELPSLRLIPMPQFYSLFQPLGIGPQSEITQQQAAKACYNFLTTGEPHWKEACGLVDATTQ